MPRTGTEAHAFAKNIIDSRSKLFHVGNLFMTSKLRNLKGVVVGAALLSLMPSSVWAQSKGPRITTQQEIFNFGIIPEYCEVSHVFWLRNSGSQPVTIDKLIPNCGCTQASIDKHNVKPGDSSRVELIFGSHNYHHEVEKFAQVISDAQGRVPALTFQAYVVPDSESYGPLQAIPRALNLDKEMPEQTPGGWVSHVTLKNNGETPITVTTLDKPDRTVSADGFDGTLQPGQETTFTVKFEADLPTQTFSKSLTFLVSGDAQERLTIPIFKKEGGGTSPTQRNSQTGADG